MVGQGRVCALYTLSPPLRSQYPAKMVAREKEPLWEKPLVLWEGPADVASNSLVRRRVDLEVETQSDASANGGKGLRGAFSFQAQPVQFCPRTKVSGVVRAVLGCLETLALVRPAKQWAIRGWEGSERQKMQGKASDHPLAARPRGHLPVVSWRGFLLE